RPSFPEGPRPRAGGGAWLLTLQRTERALDLGLVAGGGLAGSCQGRTQLIRTRIGHALQRGRGFDGLAIDRVAAFGDFVWRLVRIVDRRVQTIKLVADSTGNRLGIKFAWRGGR